MMVISDTTAANPPVSRVGRRKLLQWSSAGVGGRSAEAALGQNCTFASGRVLHDFYYGDDVYSVAAVKKFSWIFRDFRANKAELMHPERSPPGLEL
jgi:hypothetical protein